MIQQQNETAPRMADSVRDYCDAWGVSISFVYALWAAGKGPPRMKFGARVVIPRGPDGRLIPPVAST